MIIASLNKKISVPLTTRTVLLSGILINRVAYFLGTYGSLVFLALGISPQRLPFTLLMVGIAAVLGSLAGGFAADRLGGRRSAVSSLLLAALCMGLLATPDVSSLWVEILASINVFMMSASVPPVLNALTGGLVAHEQVTTFAAYRLALNLGTVICALLATTLLNAPVHILIIMESVVCIITAVIFHIGMGNSASSKSEINPDYIRTKQDIQILKNLRGLFPTFIFSILMFPVFAVFIQFTSTVPLTLENKSNFPMLIIINASMVIVLQVLIGKIVSRLLWVIPLVIGVLLVFGGLVIMGTTQEMSQLIIGVILFSLGEMIFAPMTNAITSMLSPIKSQSAAQGLIQAAQSAGFSFGPAAGTFFLIRDASFFWESCKYLGAACAVCIVAFYFSIKIKGFESSNG